MNLHSKLLLAGLTIFVAACDTVTSPVPLGEKPAVIEAAKWEGRWFNAEGSLDLTVVDSANGLVRISYDDDGKAHEVDIQLRAAGEWTFANITQQDFEQNEGLASSPCSPADSPKPDLPECDEQPHGYLWARVRHADNALIAWGPDPAMFVHLVEQGLIPGSTQDGSVVLGPLNAEHYEIITSGTHGLALDWENPMVFYRQKSGSG